MAGVGDPPIPPLAKPPYQASIVSPELGKSLAQVGEPRWVSIHASGRNAFASHGDMEAKAPSPVLGDLTNEATFNLGQGHLSAS